MPIIDVRDGNGGHALGKRDAKVEDLLNPN